MSAPGRRIEPPPETQRRQQSASAPEHSAWVSANAGSGKTHVLVARVIRLMLDGVDPSTILCITYTKAAAATMADRVFRTLAAWVGMSETALGEEIGRMSGRRPRPRDIATARRLFARAVETPGGLKIQTIHGFCERVLQLFPFEGNVAGDFAVLEEAGASELLARAIDDVVAAAAGDARLAQALALVAAETDDERLHDLLRDVLGRYRPFLRAAAAKGDVVDQARRSLAKAHDIGADTDASRIVKAFLPARWFQDRYADAHSWLSAGKETDRTLARALATAAAEACAEDSFESLGAIYLTKSGEPRKSSGFATKALGDRQEIVRDLMSREQERYLAVREQLRAVALLERTEALHHVSVAIFARYEQAKVRRGALDFADLIDRTLALLRKLDAAWVMHRLDRGIAHVLVDEAQDTSPAQWEIVERLVAEITAGEGQHERRRTLFVVGDEKQSIYRFQGAEPAGFARWRNEHHARHQRAGLGFERVSLQLSFRSTVEVLAAVDATFAARGASDGLVFEGDEGPPPHEALDRQRPGFVDLWPIVRVQKEEIVEDAIGAPIDAPEPGSAALQLADRLSAYASHLLRHGDPTGRPVSAGDIMILVRRRGPLFNAILRSLKRAGLPVAGADRLQLGAHIAAMDLVALGRAMLSEADDFSLACVLRSPLIGFDDDDLLAFAPKRTGTLWQALRHAAELRPRFGDALHRLARWRLAARAGSPFTFYAGVLEADGGRRAMLARLGTDAAEAIDAFLAAALDHERNEVPTLGGFLAAFERAEGEIKRDPDQGRDEIRIMTVHGAKGLEAPIVILPDTTSLPTGGARPTVTAMALHDIAAAVPVWAPRKEDITAPVAGIRESEREEDRREYNRLLYVAMTRAANGLIVCGHQVRGDAKDESKLAEDGSWYRLVETGLAGGDARSGLGVATVPAFDGDGTILRWHRPALPLSEAAPPPVAEASSPRPEWLDGPAPVEPPEPPPLKPSGAIDAADRLDRVPDAISLHLPETARQRGILAHRLLEALGAIARERRHAVGLSIRERHGGNLTAAEREHVHHAVLRVLDHPDLAALFAPGSLAEVPVSGQITLARGRRRSVAGRIDRLAVTDDRMIVADFKTGPAPAEIAAAGAASLAQLALYRALLSGLAGSREITCLLIHLDGPVILEVPQTQLDAAFSALTLV